jgi:hypothetical protein
VATSLSPQTRGIPLACPMLLSRHHRGPALRPAVAAASPTQPAGIPQLQQPMTAPALQIAASCQLPAACQAVETAAARTQLVPLKPPGSVLVHAGRVHAEAEEGSLLQQACRTASCCGGCCCCYGCQWALGCFAGCWWANPWVPSPPPAKIYSACGQLGCCVHSVIHAVLAPLWRLEGE